MKKILLSIFTLLTITSFSQPWVTYSPPIPGTGYVAINSVAIDAQSNKWCATDRGVYKFNSGTWTTYDTTNSQLVNNVVNAIAVENGNTIWFATLNGVSKLIGTTWTTYNTSNSGLTSNGVLSVTVDGQGNKWFGTGNGISKYDGSTWTTYDAATPNRVIHQIAVSSPSNIWYAIESAVGPSISGVTKFDGTNYTRHSTSTLNFPRALAVAIDAQSNVWAVGWNSGVGGVSMFDGSTWTSKTPNGNFFPNAVTVEGQNIWVGVDVNSSSDSGLYKYSAGSWTKYLSAIGASAIAFDGQGKKWIGTNRGKLMTETTSVSINEISDESKSITVYPNPATNELNVTFDGLQTEFVCIYNIDGKLVSEVKQPINNRIDVSNLPKGLYLLRVTANEKSVHRKVIITD